MTATIAATNGAGSTVPITVLSPWTAEYVSRNVVHQLVGGGIAVALIDPMPRSGTLDLLYPDAASAFAAAQLHREKSSFTLTETDMPQASMTYVVAGGVRISLDPDTLVLFVLSVSYQEIVP